MSNFLNSQVWSNIANSSYNFEHSMDPLHRKQTGSYYTALELTYTMMKDLVCSFTSEEKKNIVEKDFAQQYASKVDALINTTQYKNYDTNEKIKAINKIRNNVRDDIKIQYGLEKPKKTKKTKKTEDRNQWHVLPV